MNGLEATAEIRRRESKTGKHVPIVAMTAHALAGDRDRCLQAGMDAYISKPLRPEELLAVIEDVMARNTADEAENAPAATPERRASSPEPPPGFAEALNYSDGNRTVLAEVIKVFLEDTPKTMVDVVQAVAGGKTGELQKLGHRLNGSLLMFGAKRAATLLDRLQDVVRKGRAKNAEYVLQQLISEMSSLQENLKIMAKEAQQCGS